MMAENLYVFHSFPFFLLMAFPTQIKIILYSFINSLCEFCCTLVFVSDFNFLFLDFPARSGLTLLGTSWWTVWRWCKIQNLDTVFSLRSRWDLYARCPTLAAPHWKTSQSLVFNSSSSSLCFCAFFLLLPSLTLLVISSCRLENILGGSTWTKFSKQFFQYLPWNPGPSEAL